MNSTTISIKQIPKNKIMPDEQYKIKVHAEANNLIERLKSEEIMINKEWRKFLEFEGIQQL